MLLWVLNQELVGAKKEQSFMQQLVHTGLKWAKMGKLFKVVNTLWNFG